MTLHRAIKAGKLRQGPDSRIDTTDLTVAGFSLHPDTLSALLQDETPTTHYREAVASVTPHVTDYQERYIDELHRQIRRLENDVEELKSDKRQLQDSLQKHQEVIHEKDTVLQQYTVQAVALVSQMQQQQQRLLDMPREVVFPSLMPQPQPPEPRGAMRQRITALLREHPEGLSPSQASELLHAGKSLRATMKAMARDGRLRRLGTGRYGLP